jgi:SAM-dependent methyltransferase
VNSQWHRNIEAIYSEYEIYHQANGEEQKVFASSGGGGTQRSEAILSNISKKVELPKRGNLLDIGCGNGAFLKTFSQKMRQWKLYGSEFNDKYQEKVEQIPNVQKMYTKPLSQIDTKFNLISMIHVLEHIPHPVKILSEIKSMLTPNGLLFIQVPNPTENPFATMIADHCSHFTQDSLGRILSNSGLSIIHYSTDWVSREISLIAKGSENLNDLVIPFEQKETITLIRNMRWLEKLRSDISKIIKSTKILLFGSAISSTFAAGNNLDQVFAFVDEDESRIGKSHLKKDILHLDESPTEYPLYIPFAPPFGKKIATRLQKQNPNRSIFFS